MLDTLKAIAALVATLPRDAGYSRPSITLGVSNSGYAALAALDGAATHTSVYDDGYAIDGAEITIDGVEFRAQSDARPSTDEERADLEARGKPSTSVAVQRPGARNTVAAEAAGRGEGASPQ